VLNATAVPLGQLNFVTVWNWIRAFGVNAERGGWNCNLKYGNNSEQQRFCRSIRAAVYTLRPGYYGYFAPIAERYCHCNTKVSKGWNDKTENINQPLTRATDTMVPMGVPEKKGIKGRERCCTRLRSLDRLSRKVDKPQKRRHTAFSVESDVASTRCAKLF